MKFGAGWVVRDHSREDKGGNIGGKEGACPSKGLSQEVLMIMQV